MLKLLRQSGRLSNHRRPKRDNEEYETIDLSLDGDSEDEQGKMVDAFDLLQEMRRKGCEPNATSFTILIQALYCQEKMETAMQVFSDMEKHGCEADKDELEECLELVNEMKKIGCYPNLIIYNTIIQLAFKLGESKEGIRVWNEMEASGLSPSLDNFVNMIHGLIDQECLVEASEYFKEMVGRGLFSTPQYGLMKDLLNSLLRGEKLELSKDEACSYCLDMMEADVMPQPDTFAKLMKGLRKLYNRQIAGEITEKVRQMAAERKITFKMYKRLGERDLKEKVKAKNDGRKRRNRKRQ
ncbi:pentatricopeptide repeat (PPR) superfamily protein [Artemisia annua]|uniref:Pentatricopeptide repeat (PPR) superfamily protein n=1 Tax=Artemisia annua TaxID=35608 RepID=A0A2U1L3Q0_ARTAN|nr:pentatricopeptide repeat (PPR) superfamily protein [Artemisia annua]